MACSYVIEDLMNHDAHCKLLGHFLGRVNGLGLLVVHLPIGQTHSYHTLRQMHGPFLYLRAFVFIRYFCIWSLENPAEESGKFHGQWSSNGVSREPEKTKHGSLLFIALLNINAAS